MTEMIAPPAAPSLTPAHFWRWLLVGALLFAVVALLETVGILRLLAAAQLDRLTADVGGFRISLATLIISLASGVAYAVYAIVFLADYFFFQRFERVTGGGFTSLWLLSILRLSAGILAAWLILIASGAIFAVVAAAVSGGGRVMPWVAFTLIELIANAAVGTGFGFLLWSLQLRHSALLRRRAAPLLLAHVLGGAIGGSVLALVSVGSGMALAQLQWRVPAAMLLMLLALAVMPHLSLTWQAMRPTLAEATLDVTGTGVFIARLLATLVVFAMPGLVLYFLLAM
jgi:hypothetical protein